ncbi:MAG: adenylate kinase [Armatimonadetes bacterium]|nr:adenylate kinase [Armatimonadota bacterium]
MRIVLLGPPGSGKGTQASALQKRRGIPHIASGDILRANVRDDTELGRQARPYMDRGDLVPDALILDMMAERLSQPDASDGYILDGFPRTVAQAEALQQRLEQIDRQLDAVIYLRVPEAEILRRLSGRRTCPACNAVYHVDTMPPQREGVCDACGAELVQRQDEKPDVIRKRLEVYTEQTQPLLLFYRERSLLHEIDGTIGVDNVMDAIEDIVANARASAKELTA